MTKKKVLLVAAVLMGILLMIILLQLSTSQFASAARIKPTLHPGQKEVLKIIEEAKQNMTRSPNDPTRISVANAVIASHSKAATEMALEVENPKTKPAPPPLPTRMNTSTPMPTGIYHQGLPKYFTSDNLENLWFGRIPGQWVYVFTGSLADDPEQGVVYTFFADSPGRYTPAHSNSFKTPIRSGSVHIESFSGTRLILKTSSGDTLYFDVAAQVFLSSLDEVVPTITPLPSVTPTRTPLPPGMPYP